MKAFAKNLKSKGKRLEEFNEEIEDITTVAQDKFPHELENITYDSMQKFRSLLTKELNTIFNNIHSQNVNSLKSSLVEYVVSSNFINKKGETALIRSLLNVVEHTIKNL
ncbi:ECH_0659 family protein [Wolbachia endosymbiont of Tettigetta isshikii]|uniref:ECH_0659 family protein n=1 Tax=Wolbachia endosymbiont of Tettigetta isshikii TaxID=3239093 RepID=UPI00397F4BE0